MVLCEYFLFELHRLKQTKITVVGIGCIGFAREENRQRSDVKL